MKTQRIRIYGIVQGVGFRPFVSRAARRTGVTGTVANRGAYVEVFARGEEGQLDAFRDLLRRKAPERAAILKIEVKPAADQPFSGFQIVESRKEGGEIFVSPDIAICKTCRRELYDPENRRYLHPFINCTACGPRLTILEGMPYDRERTSMKDFPMCPQCEGEYHDPASRRYDAQPVCCHHCGPEVSLLGTQLRGREAILAFRHALAEGKLGAVKGIGGFHLCCDGGNAQAVARLRRLKRRPQKPFAVMMGDLDTVRRECVLTPAQEEILDGPQKPILLLEKREGGLLAGEVAPENPKVGVMLPYTPLHHLLFTYPGDGVEMPDCLVMTSGNRSGAPICRTDEEALAEIGGFCDLILTHNRTILTRADDSVMDFYRGEPYLLRRSRGYAPLPAALSQPWGGQVLALGGELKNAFCIGKDQLLYLSPYIGDMGSLKSLEVLEEEIARMETLLEATPQAVACDLHPGYHTSQLAHELGLPVVEVQHHYAHVLSCLAEQDWQEPVIGVSFDGTGYGTDGTIWGGEFLRADWQGFARLGSIQPFPQVGGDSAAREGWRIAVSLLHQLWGGEKGPALAEELGLCPRQTAQILGRQGERKVNTVLSTSGGRLFDGVSALLGIRSASTFEGEASMALEFRGEAWRKGQDAGRLEKRLTAEWERLASPLLPGEDRFLLHTSEIVRRMVRGRLAGEDIGWLACLFHALLAGEICAGCGEARRETGLSTVALTGGVFQNRLLLEWCETGLESLGFTVLRHRMIPPNDGGIALGQAAYALARLGREEKMP